MALQENQQIAKDILIALIPTANLSVNIGSAAEEVAAAYKTILKAVEEGRHTRA